MLYLAVENLILILSSSPGVILSSQFIAPHRADPAAPPDEIYQTTNLYHSHSTTPAGASIVTTISHLQLTIQPS